MVHRALEHFYAKPSTDRTEDSLRSSLDQMLEEFSDDADVLYLELTGDKFERVECKLVALATEALKFVAS
jgi:hypothetical protein